MITIHHIAKVSYPTHAVYALVNDITTYPQFIPFCTVGKMTPLSENKVRGTLTFAWLGIVETFVTYNVLYPHEEIKMSLVEGPFKYLEGFWKFKPLPDNQTQVEFLLQFQLKYSNTWIDYVLQPMFNTISANAVDIFIKRASHYHAGNYDG